MVEITVRALDSALAMEEVQKRLGDDALIISTTKRDGQIEIVATDETPQRTIENESTLLLGDEYRTNNFNEVLKKKLLSNEEPINPEVFIDLVNKLQNDSSDLRANIKKLNVFTDLLINKSEPEFDVKTRLQILGFRKSTLIKLMKLIENIDFSEAVKNLSKEFVSGRSKVFDQANVYLIYGQERSGKSTFSKKFLDFMSHCEPEKNYTLLNSNDNRKLHSSLKKMISDNKNTTNDNDNCIVIDYQSNMNDLNVFIKKIHELNSMISLCKILTVPVGNSYEYVSRNLSGEAEDSTFLALTKLDICDVSPCEISAYLDLGLRCMFFSGNESDDGGIYFSKVDQINTFLANKANLEFG